MVHDVSWFPTIISDLCDGCLKIAKPRCVDFCPYGVFGFEDGKAVVANPHKCGGERGIFHCSECAPLCHARAIVFPQSNFSSKPVKEEDKGLIRKTTCRICGKIYWTNRETDVCMDCEAQPR